MVQLEVVATAAHQKGEILSVPMVHSPQAAHQLDNTLSDLAEEVDMSIVEVVVPDNSEAGYYIDRVVEEGVHQGMNAAEVVEMAGIGGAETGWFPVLVVVVVVLVEATISVREAKVILIPIDCVLSSVSAANKNYSSPSFSSDFYSCSCSNLSFDSCSALNPPPSD